ncbi:MULTISPECIES: hypothetical protein [unclassified Streptomyces]
MSISIPFQRLAQTPFFFALFSLRLGLVESFPAGAFRRAARCWAWLSSIR